jgi:hypothetical protein
MCSSRVFSAVVIGGNRFSARGKIAQYRWIESSAAILRIRVLSLTIGSAFGQQGGGFFPRNKQNLMLPHLPLKADMPGRHRFRAIDVA